MWPTSNNTAPGKGIVMVTGKGNYKDTATGKFTIAKAQLTIFGATLKEKTYNGDTTATVTAVTFEDAGKNAVSLVMGDGLDYTAEATYDIADAGSDKTATVTVTLNIDKVTNYTLPVQVGNRNHQPQVRKMYRNG